MNTDESTTTTQRGREYWQSHIDAWKASGGTQHNYCRENQLSERLFSLWKNKFIKERAACIEPAADFVPVVTSPNTPQLNASKDIGVNLPNGISLQVPSSSTISFVTELIKQLVPLSC